VTGDGVGSTDRLRRSLIIDVFLRLRIGLAAIWPRRNINSQAYSYVGQTFWRKIGWFYEPLFG
jgi:hypothetical protein